MTKEEAITELDTFKRLAKSERGEKALDMAIEALEQKSCEDAISRADVKKYLSAPDANGDRVIYEDDLDLLPSVQPKMPS